MIGPLLDFQVPNAIAASPGWTREDLHIVTRPVLSRELRTARGKPNRQCRSGLSEMTRSFVLQIVLDPLCREGAPPSDLRAPCRGNGPARKDGDVTG